MAADQCSMSVLKWLSEGFGQGLAAVLPMKRKGAAFLSKRYWWLDHVLAEWQSLVDLPGGRELYLACVV